MKNKVLIITSVCCLVILSYFSIFYKFYNPGSRVKNLKEFKSVDKEKALGWLTIQGTNIDMPIVNYYTNDVSDPTYNIGWMFNSFSNQKSRMIIYSHNMKNVSSHPLIADKDQARFEQLMSYVYTSFVKKNKYIQYTTGGKNHIYKIYAISFQKQSDFNSNEGNLTKNEREDYIKNRQKQSYFNMDTDVNGNDKLLTLVTCTRFFGSFKNYSFVVDAREVRKNEKIKNYNISETKKYEKIKKILEGNDKNE